MLMKVLKYDLKYIYKLLGVFYLLTIIFALLTRIFWTYDNRFIFNILGFITSAITISLIFSTLINNIIRLWTRFVNNIYKDESYLTHTLPINKITIYTSKFLSTLITMFTSTLVILLTLFIAYYSKELLNIIKDSLEVMSNVYNSTVINIILIFFLIFFLEMAFVVQSGFTGIILGHKSNNGKLIKSVIYGFFCYILISGLSLLIVFIVGLINPNIMHLFLNNQMPSIEIIKSFLIGGIILYTLILIIFYFINLKLFKSGVNIA